MITPAQSSRNPFRSLNLTPNPTGASTTTIPPPTAPNPSASVNAGPLTQDAPPAYTLTPDADQGEETLEVGPNRPFRQAPHHPPPQQQHLTPQPSIRSQSRAPSLHQQQPHHYPTSSSAGSLAGVPSAYLDQSRPGMPTQTAGASSSNPNLAPPPRHPSSPSRGKLVSASPILAPARKPTSEFARDFYAAGPYDETATRSSAPSSLFTRPSDPSPSRYQPPPGPPPSLPDTPDDGRPTTKPIPGHPLLRNGQMLVYPANYECKKCHNMGYKSADPSRPCRRCWDHYAKPYTGALAYAPSGDSGSVPSPTTKKNSFQRPLPSFHPPHPSVELPRSQSKYTPPSHPLAQVVLANAFRLPPPNALALAPGTPRIRRRHCCRRGGRGIVI